MKTAKQNNDRRFYSMVAIFEFVRNFGDFRSVALKRCQCLERKFECNSEMKVDYTLFMRLP